jgi:hypothetical protein
MVLARLPGVGVCGAHSRRLCSVASVGHRLAQRRARQPIRIVYAHCSPTKDSYCFSSAPASDQARAWMESRPSAMTKAHIHSVVPR